MNKLTAKSITLIVAIAVVVTALIGGTVAWIMTETKPVVNTFTYGDINIDLDETDATWNDQEDQFEKEFEMIPGNDLVKDPTVTVKADSEACWLFVKLEKQGGWPFVALQIPTTDYTVNLGTSRLVNYAHERDIAVQYWTINDPGEMAYLQSIGADAIMTDVPDQGAQVLVQP